MIDRLGAVLRQIDLTNSQDPHQRELPYSEKLTAFVLQLKPQASEELRIAARGQHIGRWVIPRETFEMTRGGYLRWREELKKYHAATVGTIMHDAGYDDAAIIRVRNIILKKKIKEDPDTQTIEDALCLVFLDTQFDDLKAKTPPDKMKEIIRKTWAKMSLEGQAAALKLKLSGENLTLIKESLA